MKKIPTPSRCKSDMIDPVIKKICDKLKSLDFDLVNINSTAKISFLCGTCVFVKTHYDEDYVVVHISGVEYEDFNRKSSALLNDTFNKSVQLKIESIRKLNDIENKRILSIGINNILNSL